VPWWLWTSQWYLNALNRNRKNITLIRDVDPHTGTGTRT
jgi:hypothetical protein